jgi:hypothetical protein
MSNQNVGRSIEESLRLLGDEDQVQRSNARQGLVRQGLAAMGPVRQALDGCPEQRGQLRAELVRVYEWLQYGEDPDKLRLWVRELDLAGVPHGNALGGTESAIRGCGGYGRLTSASEQIRPFLEAVLRDESQSFSVRAGVAFALLDRGSRAAFPTVLEVLKDFCASLARPGSSAERQPVVRLQEYQGILAYGLSRCLSNLSGEDNYTGILESLDSMWRTGAPETLLDLRIARSAVDRWGAWWKFYGRSLLVGEPERNPRAVATSLLSRFRQTGSSEDCYEFFALADLGRDGCQVIAESLGADGGEAATDLPLFELLLRHGQASLLPDDERSARLVRALLLSTDNPLVFRKVVLEAFFYLPCATLSAAFGLASHPKAGADYKFLNPFCGLGTDWSFTRYERNEVSEKTARAITAALFSEDGPAKALARVMLESIYQRVTGEARQHLIAVLQSVRAAGWRSEPAICSFSGGSTRFHSSRRCWNCSTTRPGNMTRARFAPYLRYSPHSKSPRTTTMP